MSFRNIVLFTFITAITCCFGSRILAQEKRYYFYKPVTYGSDALFNPLSVLANGGFDSFQIIPDRQPTWQDVYWNSSCTNVWRNITNPLPVIDRFGWNRFIGQEIFPTSLNIDNAQYAPNIALHALGGGMVYRKLAEWYDSHEYPLPIVFGATTAMLYEFVNEAVENGPNYNPNEDCIADLLIFQPLGIVLFSFDGIAEFFSTTLNFNDWSQPVTVSFGPFAVRNAGQNFVMKKSLDHLNKTSLFFHFGDFAIAGLSFKTNTEDAFSFGAGFTSTGRKVLPRINGVPNNSITLGVMAGLYYDRNNSLLASLVYSDVPNNRIRMNIYPGFISSNSISPGFFLTVADGGASIIGLTARFLPFGAALHKPGS